MHEWRVARPIVDRNFCPSFVHKMSVTNSKVVIKSWFLWKYMIYKCLHLTLKVFHIKGSSLSDRHLFYGWCMMNEAKSWEQSQILIMMLAANAWFWFWYLILFNQIYQISRFIQFRFNFIFSVTGLSIINRNLKSSIWTIYRGADSGRCIFNSILFLINFQLNLWNLKFDVWTSSLRKSKFSVV